MLELALSLVLASSPSPVEAWAQKACPVPEQPPDPGIESMAVEASRAECLKRAMTRALDATLRPYKKERGPVFLEWMRVQVAYSRWVADACAAVEEARWVDLESGQRVMGTGYGAAERGCLQRQYAWRGFFVDALARGDEAALETALASFVQPSEARRAALRAYVRLAEAMAARAPEQVSEQEPSADALAAERPLSREDWRHYNARLARAAEGPEVLARRQCAMLTRPVADCERRLGASLTAQLDFQDVLPPAPPPPEAQPIADSAKPSPPSEPTGALGVP